MSAFDSDACRSGDSRPRAAVVGAVAAAAAPFRGDEAGTRRARGGHEAETRRARGVHEAGTRRGAVSQFHFFISRVFPLCDRLLSGSVAACSPDAT